MIQEGKEATRAFRKTSHQRKLSCINSMSVTLVFFWYFCLGDSIWFQSHQLLLVVSTQPQPPLPLCVSNKISSGYFWQDVQAVPEIPYARRQGHSSTARLPLDPSSHYHYALGLSNMESWYPPLSPPTTLSAYLASTRKFYILTRKLYTHLLFFSFSYHHSPDLCSH